MKVITYQDDRGHKITLSKEQSAKLTAAGVWPKSHVGSEYAEVSMGEHSGEPDYTDQELAEKVGLESL